ncbi:hypothetical protein like AT4G29090 [Hibiscus trionum]|nr:hypothetical protein like AT4G29090 [Hibiscus trionum]
MAEDSIEWNVPLISSSFLPCDRDAILSIQLPLVPQSARLAWSGVYSVRNGYRMLQGTSPTDNLLISYYRRLWSLKCPAKVRIALWKCSRNLIPTMSNLFYRRISNAPTCPKCNQFPESVLHFSRDCFYAANIWSTLNVHWPADIDQANFLEWLYLLFLNIKHFSNEVIAYTIWSLWHARNKWIHDKIWQRIEELITFVRGYDYEFRSLEVMLSHPNTSGSVIWSRPPLDWVKVNTDASFPQNPTSSFTGMVVRNDTGAVQGATYRVVTSSPSPFFTEALAVLHGLLFAQDLGFRKIILESDSKTVISKVLSTEEDLSEIRSVTWSIKSLAAGFESCMFQFVPREGNRTAHTLAQAARTAGEDRFWVEDAPEEVLAVAETDRKLSEPP